nr:endonuclease/exonuclease/phosphatase family protein [Oceaniglobus ichthyenteri]
MGEPLRIATYNTQLGRDGPGLLLRDLLRGDAQAKQVAAIVAHIAPDVLVLQDVDYDGDGLALAALSQMIAEAGHALPYAFARLPNAGIATGLDMDGNGRTGEPRDAQGYGRFAGAGGIAVLSALPIDRGGVTDFSALLWADLPGAIPPTKDGAPFPDAKAFAIQRLSSVAHWDIPLQTRDGTVFHAFTWHGTPPVFDGPEDRNGRRNHDETALWLRYLDGALSTPPPDRPFVIVGSANLDPVDGDGRPESLRALLGDPRLQDPQPRSAGGVRAAAQEGGQNATHQGDPAFDTANWPDETPRDPGNMRVSYILPSTDWRVLDSGVFWPAPNDPLHAMLGAGDSTASRHRLVWVDVALAP